MTEAGQLNWIFILLAIAGGFLPTILWLWFWLQEDRRKPEPMRLVIKTFIVGGFGVALAFWWERLVTPATDIVGQISRVSETPFAWDILLWAVWPIAVWALIEELVKYLSTYVAALKNKACDEPLDLMIYMITAALGFAAVENVLFLLKVLWLDGGSTSSFLLTGNLRFLGSTLLHVVTSAVFGASLSLAFFRSKKIKLLFWILGLLSATALHLTFNFFIIMGSGGNVLLVLFSLWLAAMVVILLFEIIKRLSYGKIIISSP
ncbi:MAG: hypothetical protein COV08_03035 [Candidatus Vogelbacteria bacterium CG10_big_fil_rev_8_21_14_0_10_49_38]|uniref:Protease PrsW n=1 Tax=Candidatus Vogelbacteria bacterium CG10_big_fil_rev_8_21_14_0_10_49_38 TaxID=1975043 RepID=A0A2H0RJ56_9BACT|nr:MAG: hypothetical protein BK006_03045 [bacterium CG10_49_38]PIR45815.1 MAG: hypothetical protein COV08_03035 [Candidatus Vogelbacteria bacterium CG10_big_fil_rev_8_21_14_0_10_49_38]